MSTIVAEHREIHPSVVMGDDVRIVARQLVIEQDVRIEDGAQLLGDSIVLRSGSVISQDVRVTAIDGLTLGVQSVLGPGLRASGRRIDIGDYFWSTHRIVIGGGGWQGRDSILTVGDGSTFIDGTYVNLSERVTVGERCALSADVVILTHGCWQAILEGFPSAFAPVTLEADVVAYVKAVVLPGVTIREGTTVAANSVVVKDTTPFSLVGGVPARVVKQDIRSSLDAASRYTLVTNLIDQYAATLDWKGVQVVEAPSRDSPLLVLEHEGGKHTVRLMDAPLRLTVQDEHGPAVTFDLDQMRVSGITNVIAEDIRDFLRRKGVRFFTGLPFRGLAPAGLRRLRALARNEATS